MVVDGAVDQSAALLTPARTTRMWDFHFADLIKNFGDTLPFTVGAAGVGPKMSGTRLAETLIISAITGAVVILGTLYVAQPVQDTKLAHLTEKIHEMHLDMRALQEQVAQLAVQQAVMKETKGK